VRVEGISLMRRSLHPHPCPHSRPDDDAWEREFDLPEHSSSRKPDAAETEG
jgi:hypothetical protein